MSRPRKQQNRKSISVKGLTYQRVKKHCEELGVSISSFVEGLISNSLDEIGVPEEVILDPKPKRPQDDEPPSAYRLF